MPDIISNRMYVEMVISVFNMSEIASFTITGTLESSVALTVCFPFNFIFRTRFIYFPSTVNIISSSIYACIYYTLFTLQYHFLYDNFYYKY